MESYKLKQKKLNLIWSQKIVVKILFEITGTIR